MRRSLISYAIGFIFAAMIVSAIGMANSLVHLDSDGCVIWGITLIGEGVFLNVALDWLE